VIQNRGRVCVVNVTVRHEDEDNLAQGRNSNLEKYSLLIPHIRTVLGARIGEVLPMKVIPTTMGSSTIESLRDLNINDRGS
jgi:hypothetical protein